MLIQKLFRYLMFAWIILLLFLMFVLKSNMTLVNNNVSNELSLFELFFNTNDNEQIDFLLQEKLTNNNNKNNNVSNVVVPIQPPAEKVSEPIKNPPNEWIDIPLNKTQGNAQIKNAKIIENESSVDVILTYEGELGGYSGTSIFSKVHKNLIVGKFVDLYGTWNHIAKNFYHKKDDKQTASTNAQEEIIYKKIMIYDHKNYLRITLESPKDKYTTENVIKVKVQKNSTTNEVKISFYY